MSLDYTRFNPNAKAAYMFLQCITRENLPPPIKIAGEISQKEKNEVFWHEYLTLLKQNILPFF